MSEARIRAEGELRWVQASGSGSAWATGATPASGLAAYVTEFGWTSGSNIIPISNRGIPTHFKETMKNVITINMTVQYAATADLPVAASGSGASVQMVHLEFRMKRPELAGYASAGSGAYYQFMGVPINQMAFTEADPNTMAYTLQALAMASAASGYLG